LIFIEIIEQSGSTVNFSLQLSTEIERTSSEVKIKIELKNELKHG